MSVLLLLFRKVKPALWKVPLRASLYFVDSKIMEGRSVRETDRADPFPERLPDR